MCEVARSIQPFVPNRLDAKRALGLTWVGSQFSKRTGITVFFVFTPPPVSSLHPVGLGPWRLRKLLLGLFCRPRCCSSHWEGVVAVPCPADPGPTLTCFSKPLNQSFTCQLRWLLWGLLLNCGEQQATKALQSRK